MVQQTLSRSGSFRLVFQLVILMIGIMGSVTNRSAAQETISESEWKRGFHGFNMLCRGLGMNHLTFVEWRNRPEAESVLVVFGEVSPHRQFIDRFVERGGAVLVASDQQRGSTVTLRTGIGFSFAEAQPIHAHDAFSKIWECPIVSDTRQHPVVQGVNEIVTNRSGILTSNRRATIAYFPTLRNGRHANGFAAAIENRNGGRLVAVADESVFTNQMIAYRDNALFAKQALEWLSDGRRTNLMLIVNGYENPPLGPADVRLSLPAPSQEEVLDALKGLPPSALLEFGNAVATVVEDEDMVNEFVADAMKKIRPVKVNRFLIFILFSMVCLALVISYVRQKKLLRHTASEIATRKAAQERRFLKSNEFKERQWAAGVLLDSFCIDLAGRRYNEWPGFPMGLNLENDPVCKFIFRAMTRASNLFKSKPSSYWTRTRLKQLERDVLAWRQFFENQAAKDRWDGAESQLAGVTVVDAIANSSHNSA